MFLFVLQAVAAFLFTLFICLVISFFFFLTTPANELIIPADSSTIIDSTTTTSSTIGYKDDEQRNRRHQKNSNSNNNSNNKNSSNNNFIKADVVVPDNRKLRGNSQIDATAAASLITPISPATEVYSMRAHSAKLIYNHFDNTCELQEPTEWMNQIMRWVFTVLVMTGNAPPVTELNNNTSSGRLAVDSNNILGLTSQSLNVLNSQNDIISHNSESNFTGVHGDGNNTVESKIRNVLINATTAIRTLNRERNNNNNNSDNNSNKNNSKKKSNNTDIITNTTLNMLDPLATPIAYLIYRISRKTLSYAQTKMRSTSIRAVFKRLKLGAVLTESVVSVPSVIELPSSQMMLANNNNKQYQNQQQYNSQNRKQGSIGGISGGRITTGSCHSADALTMSCGHRSLSVQCKMNNHTPFSASQNCISSNIHVQVPTVVQHTVACTPLTPVIGGNIIALYKLRETVTTTTTNIQQGFQGSNNNNNKSVGYEGISHPLASETAAAQSHSIDYITQRTRRFTAPYIDHSGALYLTAPLVYRDDSFQLLISTELPLLFHKSLNNVLKIPCDVMTVEADLAVNCIDWSATVHAKLWFRNGPPRSKNAAESSSNHSNNNSIEDSNNVEADEAASTVSRPTLTELNNNFPTPEHPFVGSTLVVDITCFEPPVLDCNLFVTIGSENRPGSSFSASSSRCSVQNRPVRDEQRSTGLADAGAGNACDNGGVAQRKDKLAELARINLDRVVNETIVFPHAVRIEVGRAAVFDEATIVHSAAATVAKQNCNQKQLFAQAEGRGNHHSASSTSDVSSIQHGHLNIPLRRSSSQGSGWSTNMTNSFIRNRLAGGATPYGIVASSMISICHHPAVRIGPKCVSSRGVGVIAGRHHPLTSYLCPSGIVWGPCGSLNCADADNNHNNRPHQLTSLKCKFPTVKVRKVTLKKEEW